MSWTYDINLSTDKDKVRLLIRDTDCEKQILSNEEIEGVLGFEPNIYQCAATLIRARLSFFVDKVISYTIGAEIRGALTINRKGLVREMLELVRSYESKAIATPDEVWDRFDFNMNRMGQDTSEYQGDADADSTLTSWWNR
jgi:hypothetical protein